MTKMSKLEVAEQLDSFLSGRGNNWDWDDFVSVKIDDPELDRIRALCAELPTKYPAQIQGAYCNDQGLAVMRSLLQKLRE
jgi:hypothetical protein